MNVLTSSYEKQLIQIFVAAVNDDEPVPTKMLWWSWVVATTEHILRRIHLTMHAKSRNVCKHYKIEDSFRINLWSSLDQLVLLTCKVVTNFQFQPIKL